MFRIFGLEFDTKLPKFSHIFLLNHSTHKFIVKKFKILWNLNFALETINSLLFPENDNKKMKMIFVGISLFKLIPAKFHAMKSINSADFVMF
jgi:hypothetical protein